MRDLLIRERTVVSVIVLNALALFSAGFFTAESPWRELLFWIDYACVLFFILEAILKIRRDAWRGYWGLKLNRFDLTIVVLSLPVLASPVVDLQAFGAVLALRMGRLFRLFRLLRFIPNRDKMVQGAQRALRASVGILLGLLLLNVRRSFGATMLFQHLAPECFGKALLSCYSLFQVGTIEGWHEIPDLLVQRAGDETVWALVARLYFIVSVVIMGIIGLSLANAIFVDEMTADNTELVEQKVDALHAELRELRAELRRERDRG